MAAPVTPADFAELIPAPTSHVCERVKNTLIQVPTKLHEFMAWFLDEDGNISEEARTAIVGQIPSGVPTGAIIYWPYPQLSQRGTTPSGYIRCDGRALSRTDYATLYAMIGTNYGSGDGTTTFNVPDLTGKFLCQQGGTDYQGNTISNGATGGAAGVTLDVEEIPAHSHALVHLHTTKESLTPSYEAGSTTLLPVPGVTTVSSTGGGQAHENLPPYMAGFWLIKT